MISEGLRSEGDIALGPLEKMAEGRMEGVWVHMSWSLLLS